MGDRYTLEIKCAGCGVSNEHWHAESSGSMSFTCGKCNRVNWVEMGFVAEAITKEEETQRYKKLGFGE